MSAVPERSQWLEAMRRHSVERPGAVAIADISPQGEIVAAWTWREFFGEIEKRAAIMRASTRPGETVLVAWASGMELAAWFAGGIQAGARVALMHPRSGPGEFAAVRERTGARAVLATEDLLTRVPPGVVRLSQDSELRQDTGGSCSPGSIVLGSSGTTGLPKLVVRESAALDADAIGVARGMSLTPEDCVLCVPPLCHSYGVDVFVGATFAGAELRVMAEFDPTGAARQMRNGVTVLPGVPFVFESLSRVEGGTDSHRVRLALSAGSSLLDRVREEFTARWKVPVGQLYGATELGTVSLSVPGEDGFDARSIGRPLPGVSFRVLDVENPAREVEAGDEGQLAVRAESMLSGYVEGEAELVDGHLLTGDLARRAPDGRVTITGRLKFVIESGGFKVNPLEVEAVLSEHPDVADCAVVPLSLTDTIQRLYAFVVPRNGAVLRASELRAFLRERLAPTKIPRGFEFVGSLPRSSLGKLLRDRLPKPASEGGE